MPEVPAMDAAADALWRARHEQHRHGHEWDVADALEAVRPIIQRLEADNAALRERVARLDPPPPPMPPDVFSGAVAWPSPPRRGRLGHRRREEGR